MGERQALRFSSLRLNPNPSPPPSPQRSTRPVYCDWDIVWLSYLSPTRHYAVLLGKTRSDCVVEHIPLRSALDPDIPEPAVHITHCNRIDRLLTLKELVFFARNRQCAEWTRERLYTEPAFLNFPAP